MSHWQLLGLETGADERAIKRAYARLLKVHRPDEDAAAFQQLREAYEAALEETRWRAQWEADEDEYQEVPSAAFTDAVALDAQLASNATLDVPQAYDVVLNAQLASDVTPDAPLAFDVARVEPAAPEPLTVQPVAVDFSGYLAPAPEPEIPLWQIRQWLAEGEDFRLLTALPELLAGDWLLSFDRRQWFEEQLLQALEEHEGWSADLFDSIAALLGWDDAKGHLPCDGARWHHLLDLRAAAFEVGALRRDLQRADPEPIPAFLFKPQSDTDRRRQADGFDEDDWQHVQQMAHRYEQRNPALLERLGLVVANDWRNWLPRSGVAFCVYLWLLNIGVMAVKHVPAADGWNAVDVIRVLTSAVLGTAGSVWIYVIWRRIAMWLTAVDVPVSRALLPARLYRHGAGLLVLRHVLPCAALSAVAAWHPRDMVWTYWLWAVAAFPVLLYLGDATLRGTLPTPWTRFYRAMTKPTDEVGW